MKYFCKSWGFTIEKYVNMKVLTDGKRSKSMRNLGIIILWNPVYGSINMEDFQNAWFLLDDFLGYPHLSGNLHINCKYIYIHTYIYICIYVSRFPEIGYPWIIHFSFSGIFPYKPSIFGISPWRAGNSPDYLLLGSYINTVWYILSNHKIHPSHPSWIRLCVCTLWRSKIGDALTSEGGI